MFSFYVTLTVHTKHIHRHHTQIDVLNLSSGCWQSMGFKKWLSVLSANLYTSIIVCLLFVALQQMVCCTHSKGMSYRFADSLRGVSKPV